MFAADSRNPGSLFSVAPHLYAPAANGAMGVAAATIAKLAKSGDKLPTMVPESLTKTYPLFASSLFNLMKNAETRLP